MQQPLPSLSRSPSFDSDSSTTLADTAAGILNDSRRNQNDEVEAYNKEDTDEHVPDEADNDDSDSDSEFEFAVVGGSDESSISADEIFSNGQIRPIFPLLNTESITNSPIEEETIRLQLRNLLISDREMVTTAASTSLSSSEADVDELDSLPPEIYCVWTPKSEDMIKKKSNSTGGGGGGSSTSSSSKQQRWRLRELLRRSSSEGTESFVILTPPPPPPRDSDRKKAVKEVKAAAGAEENYYMERRAVRESNRRKTYLPYRQDLVGIFGNGNGLGLGRGVLQPF